MRKRIISKRAALMASMILTLTVSLVCFFAGAEKADADTYEGTVSVSLSEDGSFVVSDGEIAGTIMAHLEIPLQDVADIQLKDWNLEKYSYTDFFTEEPDPDAPTVLKLFLYLLEHYYGSAGSGVPLVYSGAPHHFFMNTFWGHDCNLMYYVNGTYPLYYEGWGACADGILLNDGDFVDIAMYTHWGFYTEPNAGFNYFASSESDPADGDIVFSYEAEAGEPLTVQVIRGFGNIDIGEATSFSMADELPVYYGTEVDVNAMTDLFLEDGKAEITFKNPGTYYVWTEGGAGENSGDPCSCPAVAKVNVTGEPENTPPALKEGIEREIRRSINTKEKFKIYLPDLFTDEDGDELTFKVSIDDGDWKEADPAYSFAPGADGEYALRFRANDGRDDSEDEYAACVTVSSDVPVSDDHEHELTKTDKADATCEQDGHEEYWQCSVCGKLFADEYAFREIGSPEMISGGHDWANPSYEWNEDDTKVTATRVCRNDESHVETETVGVASKDIVMQPHCMRQGRATLTSETFDNEAFKVQKKNVDTPLEPDWHDYGEWEETKAAACTENGIEVRVCSRNSSHKETREIEPLGHEWEDDFTVDSEPTCTEEGSKSVHCTRCESTKYATEIPVKAHTLKAHAGITPECEKEGAAPYWECTKCGKYFSESKGILEIEEGSWVLPAAGHTAGETVIENVAGPACTEEGSHDEVMYCENCGVEIARETITDAAPGHEWEDDFTVDLEATCTEEGKKSVHCGRCDATKYETEIPATGHDYGAWKVVKEATYTEKGEEQRVCGNDPSHVEKRAIPKKSEPSRDDAKKEETKPADEKKEDAKPSDSKTASDENLEKVKVNKELNIKEGTISTVARPSRRQMIVKWRKVKSATNYKIAYRKAGAKKWTEKWTKGKNKYTLKKMKKNGLYEFRLMAVKKNGSSWTSSKWSKVNYRFYAKVKQKLKAGKNSVTVNVKKCGKASGYEVLTGTVNKFSKMKVRSFKGNGRTRLAVRGQKSGARVFVRSRPYKMYKGHKYTGILNTAKSVQIK